MCGIAGLISSELSARKKEETVRAMTSEISHRGPDAEGFLFDDLAALGHRRLSIIDLSEAANQPIYDNSGRYSLFFNGEVYNYKEIRKQLGNYDFRTESDTEVVLAAYIEWGARCLEKFNGMFALAIWDSREKELFFARDRLGIKPFYYFRQGSEFAFSSEIRALIKSNLFVPKISRKGLENYLAFQTIYAPNTILEGVYQLMPGEYGTFKDGKFQKKIYWSLNAIPSKNIQSKEEVKKEVKHKFLKAVERRLVSDVPLGAFLSGGIDSSAVVAAMASVSDQPVHTFSVSFTEKKYDESVYANIIAKKYRTEHTEIPLSSDDFLRMLPESLKAMDSPSGDGPNTYVVSKVTKEAGITVALSGLGGDELFAGYPVFKQLHRLRSFKPIWLLNEKWRKKLVYGLSRQKFDTYRSRKLESLFSGARFDLTKVYPNFRNIFLPDEIQNLLAQTNQKKSVLNGYNLPDMTDSNVLSWTSKAEIGTYTQNVLLRDSDQMSMAHALEVRVPFFDHELVEYAVSVPDRFKFPTYPKQLLVESLDPLLPKEIVHRKKMGFSFPWDEWLRSSLLKWCDKRITQLAERNVLNGEMILGLWNQFRQNSKEVPWIKIWLLAVLEEWLQNNNIN